MKRRLAALLAAALALHPGAAAAAGTRAELPKTGAPVAPALGPSLPSIQLPVLPQLSVPTAGFGPRSFQPAPEAAPRAVDQAQGALAPPGPQAAAPSPQEQSAQAARIFDAAASVRREAAGEAVAGGAALAGGLALSAFVPGLPAAPLAVEATRLAVSPRGPQEKRSFGTRVSEYAESAMMFVPMAFVTAFANALGDRPAFGPLLAAIWGVAAIASIESLAQSRSKVVGGWQASHDQKMRHDYGTGRLRDIRGRKYGEDRYDEKAPGAVGPFEQAMIRSAAAWVGTGALWLMSASPRDYLLFNLALGAMYAGSWVKSRLKRPEPAPVVRAHDR